MKKVLFIDYFFPPLLAVWRDVALTKFLPELGWQPIVISAAESVSYEKDYSLLKEVPEDTEVHRVGHREPSKEWQKEWQYVRIKFRVNYVFPDIYRTWYSPALHEAERVLKKKKIDLIYSASPSYTAAFVAMKLKRKFNIPWVAHFIDGWAVNDFLNLYYEQSLIKPLRAVQKLRIERGERDILKSADKAVAISWHVKQRMCELHGLQKGRIEVVTEGYDEPLFKGLIAHALYPDRLTITFLGSFYSNFKEPVQEFLKTVNEVNKEAEVVFIGRGSAEMQGIDVPNLTRILHLPREKALAFAAGSDFLFVVMPSYAKWIPTKIYDYLRLGKPILALVPEDGDPAKIVKEASAGFVLSYERQRMKEQLGVIFNEWREGKFKNFHPDWEYISQFERRNLVKRLVDVFNEVTNTGSNT